MIKNRKQLSRILQAKVLLDVAEEVLEKINPKNLLEIKELPKHNNLYVVGTGKGASKMAEAIEKRFKVTEGFLTIPEDEPKPDLNTIKYYYATHPLPNEKGVKGAEKILKIAEKAKEGDLVIALISGGGSALMPLPTIPLSKKITLTKKLLKSGATIQEINTVRKHLSKIKGGHLAEAIKPAKCISFIISDVLGDDLSSIASGPLVADPTTIKDAQKILKKYKIKDPGNWMETPKKITGVKNKIIANHETVVKKATKSIKMMGFTPVILDKNLDGDCNKKAEELASKVKDTRTIYIATGETTVKVKGKGSGGRNQQFALAAMMANPNITILSIGTDGVDGICPHKTAGAVAGPNTPRDNAKEYLKNNDSYHFFQKNGGLIQTGPTGTNLGDLILMKKLNPHHSWNKK